MAYLIVVELTHQVVRGLEFQVSQCARAAFVNGLLPTDLRRDGWHGRHHKRVRLRRVIGVPRVQPDVVGAARVARARGAPQHGQLFVCEGVAGPGTVPRDSREVLEDEHLGPKVARVGGR